MHPFKKLLEDRLNGKVLGIPSYCTANELVIEACLEATQCLGGYVLIEATANQVDQFGGYTGMTPAAFADYVRGIAKRVGFPVERLFLGGDHLGPLVWAEEDAESAMRKAESLIRAYVTAGFDKIHIDTSMRLGDDSQTERLSDETIAARGVRLYGVCRKAFSERADADDSPFPVIVIGSEVPIPGGTHAGGEDLHITTPEEYTHMLAAYRQAFSAAGFDASAWDDVVAAVVQPGVEFGDDTVCRFDPAKVSALTGVIADMRQLVLEGHSTDYQTEHGLSGMVENYVFFLKVGPALTNALREGLFALSYMERELFAEGERASFMETLDRLMREHPQYWQKHYTGDGAALQLKRRFSYSDRSRYYYAMPELQAAQEKLFANMASAAVPMNLLHQFLPRQAEMAAEGTLSMDPREWVKEGVRHIAAQYIRAAGNGCQ